MKRNGSNWKRNGSDLRGIDHIEEEWIRWAIERTSRPGVASFYFNLIRRGMDRIEEKSIKLEEEWIKLEEEWIRSSEEEWIRVSEEE